MAPIDFRTDPSRYRHWRMEVDDRVATLTLDVDEEGGLAPGYPLKLNSYDLGVDIELYDAVQRLRFEHPSVGAVVITSGKDRIFSAGANIRMLAQSSHPFKVNFCKFTNETRNAIEDASASSGQRYLAALNGTASGGGYELALACDHIILVDDNSSVVSLPEVPLLGVLPGTGGLTRVLDKRRVRRDLADVFATRAEGVRGRTAMEWGLVDELAPRSRWVDAVGHRAAAMAGQSDRPKSGSEGLRLEPLSRQLSADRVVYPHVSASLDRDRGLVEITVSGSPDLDTARELDDLILHLRTNELELGTWVIRTAGSPEEVLAADEALAGGADWLTREIRLYWKRVLQRLDVTSRSLIALVEPGSCFSGTFLELALAADRTYMLDASLHGATRQPAPVVGLTALNFGAYPMPSGMTRLGARYLDVDQLRADVGVSLDAAGAMKRGLVTFAPDDIDWDDEVRLALEERASFSPDALTGMEANLRFAGPETMETRIFGRLSAWQNWIFQRPNAVGTEGALDAYGTGRRPSFDRKRA